MNSATRKRLAWLGLLPVMWGFVVGAVVGTLSSPAAD